jgi:hypothetical protein
MHQVPFLFFSEKNFGAFFLPRTSLSGSKQTRVTPTFMVAHIFKAEKSPDPTRESTKLPM